MIITPLTRTHSRAISSGVERLVDIEEVTSSNLVSPTIPLFFNDLVIFLETLFFKIIYVLYFSCISRIISSIAWRAVLI